MPSDSSSQGTESKQAAQATSTPSLDDTVSKLEGRMTSFESNMASVLAAVQNLSQHMANTTHSSSSSPATPPTTGGPPPLGSAFSSSSSSSATATPVAAGSTTPTQGANAQGNIGIVPLAPPFLPSIKTLTGRDLIDTLPVAMSTKPHPFENFNERTETILVKYVLTWPTNAEKTMLSTYSTKRSKVVIKNEPSMFAHWEEYLKDILITTYMPTLSQVAHHVVPRTRSEWDAFDTNCKELYTYHLAMNHVKSSNKIPEVRPNASIVTQNCVMLAITSAFPALVNHLYLAVRNSIDGTSLRSLRGISTDSVDFTSIRMMYFGVKNTFLQSSVGANRKRRLQILRGTKMHPQEQPADYGERLSAAIQLVNKLEGKEQICSETMTDLFIEGIQSVTHKLDWTINNIESRPLTERVPFEEVVQQLQDAFITAKEKAGGNSYNPIEPVRTAFKRGHSAYLSGIPIVDTVNGTMSTCYAVYDLEHQLDNVPSTINDDIEVKDTNHPFALSASSGGKFKKFNDLKSFKNQRTSKAVSSMKDKPCFSYRDTGTCPYGKDCIYTHDTAHLSYDGDHVQAIESGNLNCFLVKKLDSMKKQFSSYKNAANKSSDKLKRKLKASSRNPPHNTAYLQPPHDKNHKPMGSYQSAVGHSANYANYPAIPYQPQSYHPENFTYDSKTLSDDDDTIKVDIKDLDSGTESDSIVDME